MTLPAGRLPTSEDLDALFGCDPPTAEPSKSRALELYAWASPKAHLAKVALQMLAGIAIAVQTFAIVVDRRSPLASDAEKHQVLTSVAAWLAVAAAFELAYTLFTDGPDEAVNPVLLAVAAATVFVLASSTVDKPGTVLALVGLGVLIAILFEVRRRHNLE